MTAERDPAHEIKLALDREVARRFDARRVAAGLERGALAARSHDPDRGPRAGRLPAAVQWVGVAAAVIAAVLGLRSLYLEFTKVEPLPQPAGRGVAGSGRLPGAEGVVQESEGETTAKRGTERPAGPKARREQPPSPPREEADSVPERFDTGTAESAPPDTPALAEDTVEQSGLAAANAPVPKEADKVPVSGSGRRGQDAPSGPGGIVATIPPAKPAPGLVGGVQVVSLKLEGRELRPAVREVPEIGATLVMVAPSGRAGLREVAPHAGERFVFPAAAGAGRLPFAMPEAGSRRGNSRAHGLNPRGNARQDASGAYYARFFLGSDFDPLPLQSQGMMGDGIHVVPLRENEVWGDEEQERFLSRTFRLGAIVAVDGARIPPKDETGVAEASFVAGVAGQLYDVSLAAMPTDVGDRYRIDVRLSRRVEAGAPSRQGEGLAATLVIENGRIVVLGVPERGLDRDSRATGRSPGRGIAFLALSPRFDEKYTPFGSGEEVFLVEEGVDPPVLIERTLPDYPDEARRLRAEGKVVLEAVIRKDGSVDGVQVLRVPEVPGGAYLVETAASAVREWRYLPARVGGEPVNAYFTVVMEFNLD